MALPEEKIVLKLDSQKTYRVFENLYMNIIKYAMPHTRVYISGNKTETGIWIELKNMSAAELNIAPEELTERFVRGMAPGIRKEADLDFPLQRAL